MIFLSCTLALPVAFNGTIRVTYRKVAKNSTDVALVFRNEMPRLFLSQVLDIQDDRVLAKIQSRELCKRIEKNFWYAAKVSSSFEAGFLILVFNAHFSFLAWYPRVQCSCFGL